MSTNLILVAGALFLVFAIASVWIAIAVSRRDEVEAARRARSEAAMRRLQWELIHPDDAPRPATAPEAARAHPR